MEHNEPFQCITALNRSTVVWCLLWSGDAVKKEEKKIKFIYIPLLRSHSNAENGKSLSFCLIFLSFKMVNGVILQNEQRKKEKEKIKSSQILTPSLFTRNFHFFILFLLRAAPARVMTLLCYFYYTFSLSLQTDKMQVKLSRCSYNLRQHCNLHPLTESSTGALSPSNSPLRCCYDQSSLQTQTKMALFARTSSPLLISQPPDGSFPIFWFIISASLSPSLSLSPSSLISPLLQCLRWWRIRFQELCLDSAPYL